MPRHNSMKQGTYKDPSAFILCTQESSLFSQMRLL